MQHYAGHGFKEFYLALGYRGDVIKRYFLDYQSLNGSLTVDFVRGHVEAHQRHCEDWIIHLMDTGIETNTGGRLKRLQPHLKDSTSCSPTATASAAWT